MKNLHLYDILKKPINTSKTCIMGNMSQYAFITFININKFKIKKVVKKLFGIKVKKVSIINSFSNLRLFKGIYGNTINKKKIYICICNN